MCIRDRPITIGAAVSSLTNIIDMVMIRQRLQSITVTPELFQTLTNYFGIPQLEAVIGELMQVNPSEILYGSYSGFAIPMFNLPPTIVMALSMSVVPAISGAFALKNKNQARRLTESTVRITTMFAGPCAVGPVSYTHLMGSSSAPFCLTRQKFTRLKMSPSPTKRCRRNRRISIRKY